MGKLKKHNGVSYFSKLHNNFEKLYIEVRNKENRVFSDAEVSMLPEYVGFKSLEKEWGIRKKSALRFMNYINKSKNYTILEIGCGNGWFSNMLTLDEKHKVYGIDVNVEELEQGARVFKKPNLEFIYGDIFNLDESFNVIFDIIILNASVQYFPDFEKLINQLKKILKSKGEIHIIDSPFYTKTKVKKAKQSSLVYYTKLGFPKMANNYFHHTIEAVKKFKYLYTPSKLKKYLRLENDSPFPWLVYKHE